MGKMNIAYWFIESIGNILYNHKGKMKGEISNMEGKIQIEIKDLIKNHFESVSDNNLFAALIFPSC